VYKNTYLTAFLLVIAITSYGQKPNNIIGLRAAENSDFKESEQLTQTKSLDEERERELRYEELFRSGKDLQSLAEQAAMERKIDECLSIYKATEFCLAAAIRKTCDTWIKVNNGDDDQKKQRETKYLRDWAEALRRKYPDEAYLKTVEAIQLFFDNRPAEARKVVNSVVGMLKTRHSQTNYPAFGKDKASSKPAKAQEDMSRFMDSTYLFELGMYMIVNGFTKDAVELEAVREKISQESNSVLIPSCFNIRLQYVLGNKELITNILNKSTTSEGDFCEACETLMPTSPQLVVAALRKRLGNEPKNRRLQIHLAKILWMNGEAENAAQVVEPLLAASNAKALEWWDSVKTLRLGTPDGLNKDVLVRIVLPCGVGSGFFVSNDGYVVTAAHNIALSKEDLNQIKVIDSEGIISEIEKAYIHPENDLAVLSTTKKSTSYLEISKITPKPRERLFAWGFPHASVKPYYFSPQVCGKIDGASDIMYTGPLLTGMSGGPVICNGKAVALMQGSFGGTTLGDVDRIIEEIREWSDKKTNISDTQTHKNIFLNATLAPAQQLLPYLSNEPGVLADIIPDIYEKPLEFRVYLAQQKTQIEEQVLQGMQSAALLDRKVKEYKKLQDTQALRQWLNTQEIDETIKEYITAKCIRNPEVQKNNMLEILKKNPDFSPVLTYMAVDRILVGTGSRQEVDEQFKAGKEQAVISDQVINPAAFQDGLKYMEAYWALDPDLRIYGVDVNEKYLMPAYFKYKRAAPLMLAQANGTLNNDFLKKLARNGNPLAAAVLATKLYESENKVDGLTFALESAEAGEPVGQYILAMYYLSGTGTVKNEKRGFEWAMQSAEAGDPKGSTIAGFCLVNGVGTDVDREKGMELIDKGAKGGDENAIRILKNPSLLERMQF